MARFSVIHGETSKPGYRALTSGANSSDEEIEGDGAIIDSLMSGKKKVQPEESCTKPRYFYNQAPPALPVRAIEDALRAFRPLKSPRGSAAIFRERMQNRVPCPLGCGLDFAFAGELMQHLAKHAEVQAWLGFKVRAGEDWRALNERRDELAQAANALERKAAGEQKIQRTLQRDERAQVRRLIEERHFDEEIASIASSSPWDGGDLSAFVKETDELKKLRSRLRDVEDKRQWLQNNLERKQVQLQNVQKKISRFQKCVDTRAVARGGDDDELKRLLQSEVEFSPAAGVSKGVIIRGRDDRWRLGL
jgi:hypothetical protein